MRIDYFRKKGLFNVHIIIKSVIIKFRNWVNG